MYIKRQKGPVTVKLPDGTVMSRSDLPPLNTVRWVASRKAAVVKAVRFGLVERDEALNYMGFPGKSSMAGLQRLKPMEKQPSRPPALRRFR